MAQTKSQTKTQTRTVKAENTEEKRPENYAPQPGRKAILSLADFTDDEIFAELRRRSYSGELRYSKVMVV